jgi:hypothetical protein
MCFVVRLAVLQGVNITNTGWSDVVLRENQQMFLCRFLS